jgi:membrane protease YdiL (CAAX protease family)
MDELTAAEALGGCPSCRRQLQPASRFCTHCGYSASSVSPATPSRHDEERLRIQWGQLKRVGGLFLWLLFSLLILGMIDRGLRSPRPEVFVAAINAVAVAAFAVAGYRDLLPLLNLPRFDIRSALQMSGAVIAFVVLVSAYFSLLAASGSPVARYSDRFLAAGWPIWSIYIVISVAPAIVEEVAFRGVIQGSLEKVFSRRDAWLIQGALFGLLHLSPLVFPSHMLMGLCFGFLRNRSNSLYPGMLVHGGWNAWVIYSEIAAH